MSVAIQLLAGAVAAVPKPLVSVAAGPAQVRVCWRSSGSVAAGAARDRGCWSSLGQLQRLAEAAGAARPVAVAAGTARDRSCQSSLVQMQLKALGARAAWFCGSGRWLLDQLLPAQHKVEAAGQVAAGASRDRVCLSSSEHLQRGADAAGVALDSCCRCRAGQRLPEQPGTATVLRQAEAAGAVQLRSLRSSARLPLPEQLVSVAAGAV